MSFLMTAISTLGSAYLIPIMLLTWFVGMSVRLIVYYTVYREYCFTKELEKRLHRLISSEAMKSKVSFYVTFKRLLEKTYYECFKLRSIMKRRRMDYIDGPFDRLFLIQHGSAWLVRDSIRMTKFLRWNGEQPRFLEISKSVFKNNPCFNKVFGVIPLSPLNDVLNLLPGLFIIGGIFGTFLGIMNALPGIGAMDLSNVAQSKATMDAFLDRMAFAMMTSIIGIILSVSMTVFASIFSPEKVFLHTVEKFEMALSHLWQRSDNNEIPLKDADFDENKDSFIALAELSIRQELASKAGKFGSIELDPEYGTGNDPIEDEDESVLKKSA